jgi:hypothetical protein
MRLLPFFLLCFLLLPDSAHAYVGPGLGAGAIAAVIGVIGAILLAAFSMIYYPIKRARRKRSEAKEAKATEPAGGKPAAGTEG